jgi:hypothetical protein
MPGGTDTIATVVLGTAVMAEEGPAMGNNTELLSTLPPAEDAVAAAGGITVEDGTVPIDVLTAAMPSIIEGSITIEAGKSEMAFVLDAGTDGVAGVWIGDTSSASFFMSLIATW